VRAVQLIIPPEPLEDVTVPYPRPAPNEVVVRISASGICHSDAHYRSGDPKTRQLPITLGHEIAGKIEVIGTNVDPGRIGERVAVHYVVSDSTCNQCYDHGEQFCENYGMVGLTMHGGYAEAIAVPERNAVPVPDSISDAHAAIMMCSSATSLHALRKARFTEGETVAVFGVGGLGMSAVQLANTFGANRVYAVDIDKKRLAIATELGAVPIPTGVDPGAAIAESGGADIALVLVNQATVFARAMESLKPQGRLIAVGIVKDTVPLVPYQHLILGEHELIGSNDHLRSEIVELFELASQGRLQFDSVVTEQIPLDASAINSTLDRLDSFGPGVRSVITP